MYYTDENRQNRLGYSEYQEVFYDLLSRIITNQQHIELYKDYYEHIVFKTYERYENSKTEIYSIRQIITVFEICLDSMFKFKPSVELPEDVITVS